MTDVEATILAILCLMMAKQIEPRFLSVFWYLASLLLWLGPLAGAFSKVSGAIAP